MDESGWYYSYRSISFQLDEAESRIRELERVLGMVEFVPDTYIGECLWCHRKIHTPDCPRQKALGLSE